LDLEINDSHWVLSRKRFVKAEVLKEVGIVFFNGLAADSTNTGIVKQIA
ncbi:hypothetical protein AVEN_233109-1, partial [Araneus ventricosus]